MTDLAARVAEIREWGYIHVLSRDRADAIAEAARAEGMDVEVVEQRGFWEVREA